MSLQAAGKMLLKDLRPSTEEEARQAIMEKRKSGAVEEPDRSEPAAAKAKVITKDKAA